ncbi:hypothetical protein [Dysgonomonas termitidis]|uniref:Cell division protein FtsZ n=1 Tax=Dysgonomonas termitidis TaxID=1516126 RepID=A0ABV9KSG0_9BACT
MEECKRISPIIKLVGAGGGGGNIVNQMYNSGICDIPVVLCDTDRQALCKPGRSMCIP